MPHATQPEESSDSMKPTTPDAPQPSNAMAHLILHAQDSLQDLSDEELEDMMAELIWDELEDEDALSAERDRQAIESAKKMGGSTFLEKIMGADFYQRYYPKDDTSSGDA